MAAGDAPPATNYIYDRGAARYPPRPARPNAIRHGHRVDFVPLANGNDLIVNEASGFVVESPIGNGTVIIRPAQRRHLTSSGTSSR